MTPQQRALLELAIKDGAIINTGIDRTPGLSTRVLNSCIDKGWLHVPGTHRMDLGGLHYNFIITDVGRAALKETK